MSDINVNIKYCQYCKNEIPLPKDRSYKSKAYQNKKFCCKDCHNKSMIRAYTYKCAECSNEVIRKKPNLTRNVFCNYSCKGKYLGKMPRTKPREKGDGRISKICNNCGKDYSVVASRINSKFCSLKCKGETNAKHSPHCQPNRVLIKCSYCEKEHERTMSDIELRNFCSMSCMGKYYKEYKLFTGENNGAWNGGKVTYRGKNWQEQRQKAKERDEYTCTKCGIKEEELEQSLSVHHIIPFQYFKNYQEANDLENLVCVCESCHRKIHSGDNHHSKFKDTYKDMVEDIV